MAYACRVECDSINDNSDQRLTTFVVTYPRFVHAELLTHRMLSRNSSSSRAIPIEKMIEQVQSDPAMPVWWGKNQSGMQAREELEDRERTDAQQLWLEARDQAVLHARCLNTVGLHKQIANRVLEPWMWITVIVSATEWSNFFNLRCHPDAQPEIRKIADMMKAAYEASTPRKLLAGEYHLPFWREGEDKAASIEDIAKICVARCARVSYLTHDGRRDLDADLALFDRLAASGHWSPFEHVAMAMAQTRSSGTGGASGNFAGWLQVRKMIERGLWNGGRR